MRVETSSDIDEKDFKILTSGGFDSVEVTSVMSQDSLHGSVIVSVAGYFISKERPAGNFVQCFFFAPQENGYFVFSDIFKFVDDLPPKSNDFEPDNGFENDSTISFGSVGQLLNQPGDLEPPSLIDEGSPMQKALHNGNRQEVPDFGYSAVPQNGSSGSSRNYNTPEPERKPRHVAPPRRESPSPAKPSRPSPSQLPIQRDKEHKEVDFDTARKRLQQNYKQAENAKKQRTIQVMEIPKPRKVGFFPRKGGSFQGGRQW